MITKTKATPIQFVENGLCNWSDCVFNKPSNRFTENMCTNEEVTPETCPVAAEAFSEHKESGD